MTTDKKPTMRQTIFYRLFTNRRGNNDYIAVHEFMGEYFIEPLLSWGYVSYECSARLSEIYTKNPGLLDRQMLTGKSGAQYYGYRIHPDARGTQQIADEDLLKFYELIKDVKVEDKTA